MISIGKIDGNADDVMNSLKNYGIPPYLHYVGSRYDRSWVRVLIAQQPVRLEMVLTQPVRKTTNLSCLNIYFCSHKLVSFLRTCFFMIIPFWVSNFTSN